MSTPIVLQLQELASDPSSEVEELIKKALLVATKLKLNDLKDWCSQELKGYGKKDKLPDYRLVVGDLFVENPYHGLVPFILPDDMSSLWKSIPIKISISEISNLLLIESQAYRVQLPQKTIHALMSIQGDGISPLMPRLVVNKSQFMGIVSAVKNIIFEWSLKLEEQGIVGEGLQFSKKEKETAMSVSNFHIGNMQGVVGNVTGGTINQQNHMAVQAASFDSLAKYLLQSGLEYSDVSDLKNAIDTDPEPSSTGKFGNRVSAWMGSMVAKAAQGSWAISAGAAGNLLADAISRYYGLK